VVLLFVVNSTYYLPGLLLERKTGSPGFVRALFRNGWRGLFVRKEPDLLRISVDFVAAVFCYPALLSQHLSSGGYAVLLSIWFGFTWLYHIYYYLFSRVYHLRPVIANDWFMIKVALRIFVFEFGLKNFLILLGALTFAALSHVGIEWVVQLSVGVRVPVAMSLVASLVVLYSAGRLAWRDEDYQRLTLQSQLVSIIQNCVRSVALLRKLSGWNLDAMLRYNVHADLTSTALPNIHFIVVESYGCLVMDDPRFADAYHKLIMARERDLNTAGWRSCSRLTMPPVIGGGSWLSYTTMMYGLNVDGQARFLRLFGMDGIESYDSLFNWLRRQGYFSYRLSSLGGHSKMPVPYDRYSLMYGVDRWIKYADLDYKGPEYGFGPSPPDQFALWKASSLIAQQGKSPYALFYITQNSHSPFDGPDEVADDWRSLRDPERQSKPNARIWSRPDMNRYGRAIEYQLNFIVDYVLKNGSEDDVFILIGDHQPATLGMDIDSRETPMHVISRQEDYVKSWVEHGFAEGLDSSRCESPVHQAGILSIFRRTMLLNWGRSGTSVPNVQPEGITLL